MFSFCFACQAWNDFLKQEGLTEEVLLKSYQVIPRVGASPTYRKGLYAGAGEAGAVQALSLLENYLTTRLAAPQFATSTVKVCCHNHTPFDLAAHFADTSLPAFSLTADACGSHSDMSLLSLPPPGRPLRLKFKVKGDRVSVEFWGNNFPLRHALADSGFSVGTDLSCIFCFF